MNLKRLALGIVVFSFLGLWLVTSLFPLYFMVQTAFTPETDIRQIPPRLFPSRPTLANFRNLFQNERIWRWVRNSVTISGAITAGTVFICSMAAYSLSKFDFRGRKFIFTMIVSTILVPAQVTLLPTFILVNKLNLTNTLWAVIIPSLSSPYIIFMMRQYMLSISSDYIDAARVDGASEWSIYAKIILPMSSPVIATSAIFTFISSWNGFLWPLIVLNDPDKYPLTVGLATMQRLGLTQFGLQMAGAMFSAVPMVLIFFSFQKYFMKGLMSGGTKG